MDVPAFVLQMKARWVAKGLPDYPMWIAAVIDSAALTTAAVAVAQRNGEHLPVAVVLGLVALAPWAIELWSQANTWPLFVVLTGGATTALMLLQPLAYDFAPFLLVLMTGHVTACAGVWRGLAVLMAGELVIIGLGIQGTLPAPALGIWAIAIVIALDIGYVLRTQQLLIDSQVREHQVRERQVVLEERQRIARDVHDLVAHSLSVTMLHLTAARREVEEAARGEGSLDDAVGALYDAERVGRRAMNDVRGTVGMLGQEPGLASAAPAPGLADVPALVEDFRGAGLVVTLETVGDLTTVPPATALGLYRIVQESLANVAKHAPGAAATVRLDVARDPGELIVRNDLPRGVGRPSPGGSGLTGMAARADQLGARLAAGPEGRTWVVRVELPRGDGAVDGAADEGHECQLPRLAASLRRAVPETP